MKLDESTKKEIEQMVRDIIKADPDGAIRKKATSAASILIYGDEGEGI